MKTLIRTTALVIALVMMVACSATTSSSQSGTTTAASTGTTEKNLQVGMTKSQVIAIWGEPSGRQVTPREEVWSYGGQRWLRQIPYAGPFMHVNTSKVVFVGGRVVDFRNTDEGDIMSADIGYGAGRFSNY
jgi:hypothetical protein